MMKIHLKVNEVRQLQDLTVSLKKASGSYMYREKFKKNGINPMNLKQINEIEYFPFTTKADLKRYSFEERLAVSLDQVLRIHTSSGTSGIPTAFGYTAQDLMEWRNNLTMVLSAMGFNRNDTVLFPAPLGLPTGLGYLPAFESVGALLLPTGPGRTSGLQIPALLGEFGVKPNALCCLPSYLFRISETAIKEGINPKDLGIRKIQTGGEAFTPETKRKAEAVYNARLFEGYGLSEAWGGPSVASSADNSDDLTVWEEYFLIEIIDPVSLKVLPPGEEGELVITSLKKDAHPIIRYRTGDLTKIVFSHSNEYRPLKKIAKIKSRLDDLVKVKGVQLYPMDFEAVLNGFDSWNGEFEVILNEKDGKEEVTVNLEAESPPEYLQTGIQQALKEKLNITCSINVVDQGILPRAKGKTKRIKDMRVSSKPLANDKDSFN